MLRHDTRVITRNGDVLVDHLNGQHVDVATGENTWRPLYVNQAYVTLDECYEVSLSPILPLENESEDWEIPDYIDDSIVHCSAELGWMLGTDMYTTEIQPGTIVCSAMPYAHNNLKWLVNSIQLLDGPQHMVYLGTGPIGINSGIYVTM